MDAGSAEIRELKHFAEAQGWARFWRVLLFPELEMGKPQWAVAGSSHLRIIWTPRPSSPHPCVWTPGQVGQAGRLLPPQDVRVQAVVRGRTEVEGVPCGKRT